MVSLRLEYWAKGDRTGFTDWRLAGEKNARVEFPSCDDVFNLSHRFFPYGGIAGIKHLNNSLILSLARGSRKEERDAFVKAIEERISQ